MSLGVLIGAAEEAFRASEDGLTPGELGAVIGTRWPERVVSEMRRKGRVFGEEHGRLYLSDAGVERRGSTSGSSSEAGVIVPPAAASLSTESGRLFEVDPERPSHYDLEAA